LEKKKPPGNALPEWEACMGADGRYPEEDTWKNLAKQKINKQGSQ
jgi:hypothetical protein